MHPPHRILFYNWVPFDDDEGRGGGVSIYQRNLVEALTGAGWQVDFFSGGVAYDLESDTPRFERSDNPFDPDCRSFSFVNSPVLSPGHAAFGQNDRLFDQGPAFAAWLDFLRANGPYDIVHFNNIEGIPFAFLDLKSHFPDTLVVLSHHNYFAICPQVNLWHAETTACTDFDQGRACVDCLTHRPPRAEVLAAHQAATLSRRAGRSALSPEFARLFQAGDTVRLFQTLTQRQRGTDLLDDPLPPDPGAGFASRRIQAVALINRSVDLNLAVSARVAQIVTGYGIDAARTHVSYIGTKHGQVLEQAQKRLALRQPGQLAMVYMGYMRADKGFLFLLDALEQMPADLARALHVTLAAKSTRDPAIEARMAALKSRLGRLTHIDGYDHADLPKILADQDLGLVPVMWEDNMPQVALEIMSHGLPVLASDRGGAQELGANADFTFAAGSAPAFAAAVGRLQSGEVPLASFWSRAMRLRSMDDHLTELLAHYDYGLSRLRGTEPPLSADRPQNLAQALAHAPAPTLPSSALANWIVSHA